MRILLLWPIFHPAPTAASIRGMAFAKHLAMRNNEVQVITSMRDTGDDPTQYEGFKVRRLWTYDSLSNKYGFMTSCVLSPIALLRIRREIRAFRPDLIIASSPAPFLAFEGFLSSRSSQIPFVYDMRDSWRQERFTHRGVLRNVAKEAIERLLCQKAELVFCVSDSLRQSIIQDYEIPDGKVKVVTNGNEPPDEPLEIHEKEYDLVFSGYPARYRNVEELLKGIAIASEKMSLRMICLGWKGAPEEDAIRSEAMNLGIEGNLYLVPPVPQDQVRMELQKARVGVTSLSGDIALATAIGAKTYEYLAAGLPVACLSPFEASELQRFVENNEVGFYSKDSGDFANEIVALLTDKDKYSRISQNAIQVSRRFSWKSIVDKMYNESLSQFEGGRN